MHILRMIFLACGTGFLYVLGFMTMDWLIHGLPVHEYHVMFFACAAGAFAWMPKEKS